MASSDSSHENAHNEPTAHPLSFAQERLWFLEQLEPGTAVYNVPYALRLCGTLYPETLRSSLDALVVRHEVLRSVFVAPDGVPAQRVLPPRRIPWTVADLEEVASPDRDSEMMEELIAVASRPFDLASNLPIRAHLIRLSDTEHVLLLVLHHIATDGSSTHILLRELAQLYNAQLHSTAPGLPALGMQYTDFARWQRERLSGSALHQELEYWRSQMEDNEAILDFPTDFLRPIEPFHEGERASTSINADAASAIRRLAREERATPFMVLVALLFALLRRYGDLDDISIGAPIAGRMHPDSEDLIGFFVNMVVLREQVSPQATLRDLIRSVRGVCLDAYDHQELPFEKLVAELQTQRTRNRTPFFQVSFSFQPPSSGVVAFEGLNSTPVPVYTRTSKFDLDVWMQETSRGLDVQLTYPTALFQQATMEALLATLSHLCSVACDLPDARICELPLAHLSSVLSTFTQLNGTARTTPRDQTVNQTFSEIARNHPEQIAVELGAHRLTYHELDEHSTTLARALRRMGVRPNDAVALHLPRSIGAVIALVGALKAGACYVPLDPNQPKDWLAQIVSDAQPIVVITSTDTPFVSKQSGPEIVELDALLDSGSKEAEPSEWMDQTTADTPAYIIYTSGSTGRPKGTVIPHRGILRLVTNPDYVQLGNGTRILHLASPSFDASTFELWGALLNGGKCVLPPHDLPSVSELAKLIRDHGINTLWLTSTWFNAVVDEAPEALLPLTQLLIGGEALSVRHVRRALDALPDTQIINGYGPTENTTFTCCYSIPKTLQPNATSVPIGRPISGTYAYVLDDLLQPVPIGVPGELCVGGDGLALGYLGDAELTAERFITDPLQPESGRRIYRTGDRVRLLPSNELEYLGRLDRQLKVRGFRVEPGEIEHVLAQHPSVSDVHVVLKTLSETGPEHLVAYVVPAAPGSLDHDQLLAFAGSKLPEYMVPSYFEAVASFPREASGKIDGSALPAVSRTVSTESSGPVAPRNELEDKLIQIWQQLLQLEDVGIRHNFFELGGHSLLAVRLIAQVESAFRASLPLAVLFDSPTIEALAARIEQLDTEATRSTMIPLRAGGNAPFFCVPPAGASVYHFSELVPFLSEGIDFYGVQPLGLEPGETPQLTVEQMAARYVHDLRAIQPRGPYRVGGRCFGAFVAFEMAQQLVDAGHEVSRLVLMDPSAPPGISRDAKYYADRVGYFRRRGQLLPAVFRYLRSRIIEIQQLWLRGLLANAPARRLAREQRVHRRAQDRYRPRPYPGTITFLGADEDYHPEDTRALWQQLTTSEFDLHLLPGNHRTITQEPNLRTFALTLEKLLLEASAEDGPPTEDGHQ